MKKSIQGKNKRLARKSASFEEKVDEDPMRAIVHCFEEGGCWDEIITAIECVLQYCPQDHWSCVQMANAYYEKECYPEALAYITEAMRGQFDCPAAQWVLAGILRMRGQHEDALELWEALIGKGARKMARGECSCCREGLAWGRRRIAEAKFMVSLTYSDMGYVSLARYWRDAYRLDREAGAQSRLDDHFLNYEIGRHAR